MSKDSPAAILYDEDGNLIGVDFDGVSYRLQVDSILTDGYDQIGTLTNPIRIDPTGDTAQPVSASFLPLPTGAATENTLASIKDTDGIKRINDPLPAGTNNIGDVDVLTVPAPLSTTGGGTEAAALRVTIANNSTGVLSVDDNGGSLTVDTPQLPAALVGGRLSTNIGAWLGSTAPTVGQKTMTASIPVAIASNQSTLPVSVASLPLPTGAATEATLSSVNSSLDVNLSTRASEATLSSIDASIDVNLSTIASEATLSSIDGNIDVALSTRATEATVATLLTELAFQARIPTLGQKASAGSVPVVIANDQSAVSVAQSGTWTVQQGTPPWSVVGPGASGAALSGNPVRVAGSDGTNTRNLKTDTTGRPETVGAAANGVAVAGAPVRVGGSDGTTTRDIRTDSTGRLVTTKKAATTVVTSVAKNTSSVQLLAANTARLGASVQNDSNRKMYLKLGTTASTTSFTVLLFRDFHYELPFGYTGVVTAVWDSGGSGSARITEFTA